MEVQATAEPLSNAEADGEEVCAWVQCERCEKWRRIQQSEADKLDEHASW